MSDSLSIAAISELQSSWRNSAARSEIEAKTAAEAALDKIPEAATALLGNLKAISYPKVPGLTPPSRGLEERLGLFKERFGGAAPVALEAFWRRVGDISLLDLRDYKHVAFWKDMVGMQGCCDGIHIDPCDEGWIEFLEGDHENWLEDADVEAGEVFPVSFSPDDLHRDNISGGSPYALEIGGGWLAPIRDFHWNGPRRPVTAPEGPCDLISYLRTALLECAGFPGLLGNPKFELMKVELLQGVPLF